MSEVVLELEEATRAQGREESGRQNSIQGDAEKLAVEREEGGSDQGGG